MVGMTPSEGCHSNEDSKDTTADCNPAERLVKGSPILTHIKICEEIFISQDRKKKGEMPESPLFIPKSKTSEPSEMETDSHISTEPYQQPKQQRHKNFDPYENVVITTKPYTCHSNTKPAVYYKYTPKNYIDIQHQPHVYNQHLYNSYYPQNPHVKLIPTRDIPIPPQIPQMQQPQHFSGNNLLSPKSFSGRPPAGPKSQSLSRVDMMRNKSPNYDGMTTTSGYSSYDKTMSLNRAPSSPMTLPVTSEEHKRYMLPPQAAYMPGTPPTFTRSMNHEKVILNQRIMKMYFCIALTACLACPPCGYWSLYQAFKVDDMVDNGNYLGAERLAKKIKRYSLIMLCVGLFWVSLAVGAFFLLLNKFKQ